MKKTIVLTVLLATGLAMAAPGDSWILPIQRTDGNFTTLTGAGYNGTDAIRGTGADGVRRVYWAMGAQAGMPASMELFTIEFFVPTTGPLNWQPIETANVGEQEGQMNAMIPWAGQFGTNHQWVGSENGTPGTWKSTGPGPQAPVSADYNAAGNGIYVWLNKDAQLYAKWNYPWDIDRAWSALRVTQVTPEPASAMLLLLGLPLLRRKSS